MGTEHSEAKTAPRRQDGRGFQAVVALMDRLLAEDGCPWDREQTLLTLRPYLIEEAYELLEALEGGDAGEHRDELGDLLFQIVFQAALRAREGAFGVDDVCAALVAKMEHRHPHVFGDAQVKDAQEVLANWGRLKGEEQRRAGKPRRALDGVPRALPALQRAAKLGEKAARVGFDWPDVAGVREKVNEELLELDQAMAALDQAGALPGAQESPERAAVTHEIGDVLFTLTRLAAKLAIDPEGALRGACARFEQRFAAVEDRVLAEGKDLRKTNLQELDAHWQRVKRELAEGGLPKK